jgi:short-subunit dehydrogenase
MGPYNASKYGVVAISETLHHELGMTAPQVKVSVLCPGWVNTNIADSSRNRPAHLQVDDAAAGPGAEMLRQFLEEGMAPDEVAKKVLDAIRDERFWILTHDDVDDLWVRAVARRMKSLDDRSNPQFGLG